MDTPGRWPQHASKTLRNADYLFDGGEADSLTCEADPTKCRRVPSAQIDSLGLFRPVAFLEGELSRPERGARGAKNFATLRKLGELHAGKKKLYELQSIRISFLNRLGIKCIDCSRGRFAANFGFGCVCVEISLQSIPAP